MVFDFDHTLYDGDSFGHVLGWLLKRNPARTVAAFNALHDASGRPLSQLSAMLALSIHPVF